MWREECEDFLRVSLRFYVNCKIFILLPDSAPEAAACLSCLREIPLFIPAEFYSFTLLASRKSCPSRASLWPHFEQKREEEEVGGRRGWRVRMSMVRLRFILPEGLLVT